MPYSKMTVRDHYLGQMVESASQEGLLLLLVDGAVNFIRLADAAFEKEQFDKVNNNLIKAQNIYLELTITLDLDAGEFAENMGLIYQYIYNLLIEANIDKDVEKIRSGLKLAEQIRDLWHDTVEKSKENGQPDESGKAKAAQLIQTDNLPKTGVYEPAPGAKIQESKPAVEDVPSRLNIKG